MSTTTGASTLQHHGVASHERRLFSSPRPARRHLRTHHRGFKPPEVFVAKGRDGNTDIWGVIVRPRNFDPARVPRPESIMPGHGSFVPKTFWALRFQFGGDKVIGMQSLADMGFVAWRNRRHGSSTDPKLSSDAAWKNCRCRLPDRIYGTRQPRRSIPWYDVTRVGIYGGSAEARIRCSRCSCTRSQQGRSCLCGLLRQPMDRSVGD